MIFVRHLSTRCKTRKLQITTTAPRGKLVHQPTLPNPPTSLQPLVDAEVSLCGLTGRNSDIRKTGWIPILLAGESGITVRTPAPDNPFADQPVSNGLHRARVDGTVVGITRTVLYLATEPFSLVACKLVDPPEALSVGDTVHVAGFDRPSVSSKAMVGCRVRTVARRKGPLPPARSIRPKALFTSISGGRQLQSRLNGRTIRMTGFIRGWRGNPENRDCFTLECDDTLISVDISGLAENRRPDLLNGSTARISGLCTTVFDSPVAGSLPQFKGLTLIPRGPGDLEILRTPSWWTPARFLAIIFTLLVLLTGILIWNVQLRRLSERRGRELMAEQLNRVTSDLRVSERTRLAVDLHDALSQNLTGLSLQLDAVRRFADDDGTRMRHHLEIARRTLKSCREELRNCLWDLRNHALEEKDLNEAIRRTLAPFVGDVQHVIRFNVPRERLSDNTAHALMRIVRELASNAVRHGRAKTIRIAGTLEDGVLAFSVRDDGAGFDPTARPGVRDGHFGLEGIAERIRQDGGTFELKSSPGEGTSVTITLKA